jgi:exosortase
MRRCDISVNPRSGPVRRHMFMASAVRSRYLIGLTAFGVVLFWAYWPILKAMVEKWSADPQYSHGFIVPAFAAYLLWHRRRLLSAISPSPRRLGLALIGCGAGLHLAGAYLYFDAIRTVSLLPVLAGLCLCHGGWPALRWALPSIAFLVFMLPLPFSVEGALSHPLQRLATYLSTYALQTMGFAAVSEGNIILLDTSRIGVVEACNGLGMLVTFFAMTTATILIVRRSLLESLLIVLSAIPIALIANVLRITVTAVLHNQVGGRIADVVFHDLAGWFMMPVALSLLWVEFRVLNLVLVEPAPNDLPVLGLGLSARLRPQAVPAAGAKLA